MKKNKAHLLIVTMLLIFATGCSTAKKLGASARADVLNAEALQTAHVGISIYEPVTGKYWYNYQGDKYFVPASNTKIPTCYAAMKYLGDSLVGGLIYEGKDTIDLLPTGDPTFLHKDFVNQPIIEFLKNSKKRIEVHINPEDNFENFGSGWSWNDYQQSYMVERSRFTMYGNIITFFRDGNQLQAIPRTIFKSPFFGETMVPLMMYGPTFRFTRSKDKNEFSFRETTDTFSFQQIPFVTNDYSTDIQASLLMDTLQVKKQNFYAYNTASDYPLKPLHSQPTDSLLKPMMHRSDNFFAEQTLLMVSNERLGYMSDEKIIDTLLKTDFKDLPQNPRWVDGSGLSRYNLFSPQDFVFILNKMKNEFGMPRIKNIFATGGEGTLSSYYKKDSTFIYAKTGTLSGVVAISGFLYTKKGKELIFSVLVNNHQGSATSVRRAVEKFIKGVREKF